MTVSTGLSASAVLARGAAPGTRLTSDGTLRRWASVVGVKLRRGALAGVARRGTCAPSRPQRRLLRARQRRRVARSRWVRGKGLRTRPGPSRIRDSAGPVGLAMALAAPPARAASLGTRRGRGAAHAACGALQHCACRFAGTRFQRTPADSRAAAARSAIVAVAAAAAAALAAAAVAAAVAAAAAVESCARGSNPWWRNRRAHGSPPLPAARWGWVRLGIGRGWSRGTRQWMRVVGRAHVSCCIGRRRSPQVVGPCRFVRARSQVALDAGMGQSRHQRWGHEHEHAPCPSGLRGSQKSERKARNWRRLALLLV